MDDIEIAHLDELESSHFWYKARKDQLTNWMKFLNCESLNILDLGSASGGNTLHLINLGHNVTSVEYSDIGVRLQHGKGISAIQADARCLPFSDESFDVIICLDVLEHIKEDYKVAAEINRLLTRNGHFLISVPQDPNLWSDHDVSVNHIRRYAKENLVGLLAESKLSIHEIWSTIYLLRPMILIARKFTKGSNLKKLNWFINLLFYFICKLELKLSKYHGKGVTLWACGKKMPNDQLINIEAR